MEVESALVAHPRVAEAAVVGKPHDIKGESVFAFVVLRGQRPTGDTTALVKELRDWVTEQLGAIARPDDIRFADNLPKTRSGKIMRRLLKTVARGEEITQDVSTLENPAILDQLRGTDTVEAPAAAKGGGKMSSPRKAAAGSAGTVAPGKAAKKAIGKAGQSPAKKSAPRKAAAGGSDTAASGKAAKQAANKSGARPGKKSAKGSAKPAAKKAAQPAAKKAASGDAGKSSKPKPAARKPVAKTNIRRAQPAKRAVARPVRLKSAAKKSAVKQPLRRRGG